MRCSRRPDRALSARRPSPPAQNHHRSPSNPSPLHPLRSAPLLQPSTYRDLLHASAKTQSLVFCKLAHSHMIRSSYRPGLFMQNILLCACCRCGDMLTARKLFDRMPARDAVTWNTLAAGYTGAAHAGAALDVFNESRSGAVCLDRFSYAGALGACANCGDARAGRVLHGMVVANEPVDILCWFFYSSHRLINFIQVGK